MELRTIWPMNFEGFANFKPGRLGFFILVFLFVSIFTLLTFIPQVPIRPVKTPQPLVSPVKPRVSLVGAIESLDLAKKTLKLNSQEDGRSFLVKFDQSTKIGNLFSFGENSQQLKFEDLRPRLKLSVITLETDPNLAEVTARSITITGVI